MCRTVTWILHNCCANVTRMPPEADFEQGLIELTRVFTENRAITSADLSNSGTHARTHGHRSHTPAPAELRAHWPTGMQEGCTLQTPLMRPNPSNHLRRCVESSWGCMYKFQVSLKCRQITVSLDPHLTYRQYHVTVATVLSYTHVV